jgi:TRAP-type C4-dicarboxylate transport system permease small subunit
MKTGPKDREPSADDLGEKLGVATMAAEIGDLVEEFGPIDRAVNRIAEMAGASVLAMFAVLVFGNAASRYMLNYSFVWADELIIAMMPWLGMCGMFLAIRRRQVIRIDYFAEMLPPAVRTAAQIFAGIVSAAAFMYLAVVSFDYFQLFGSDRTVYLKLQSGWFSSALWVGAIVAALAYAVDAWRQARARARASANGPPGSAGGQNQ